MANVLPQIKSYETTSRGIFFTLSRRRRIQALVALILIALGAVVVIIPLAWMISTSLKRNIDVYTFPPQWIPNPIKWNNYIDLFRIAPFGRYLLNSTIVTGLTIFGTVASCSMAAYAFARLRCPGRDLIFMCLLSALMLPYPVTMVPRFIVFEKLDWLNSFKPLIIPHFFAHDIIFVFLLRQFFRTIPVDLEDAARLDGAGTLRILTGIILPLSKPALITVAIFSFIWSWNDFLNPLLYLNTEDKYTIAIGLANFLGSNRVGPQMHLLMAGSFVATLPVLIIFLFAQRLFIRGIVFSGIKG